MSIDLDALARDASATAPEPPSLSALEGRVANRRRRRRTLSAAAVVPLLVLSAVGARSALDSVDDGTQVIETISDGPPGTTTAGSEDGVAGADPVVEGAGPSQSPESAERDGVVPEIAELPAMVRIAPSPWADLVETSEGTWMVSEPAWNLIESDSCVGDREGAHGADFVCSGSYAEILLLRADGDLRAYPFVETKPMSLFETDDAIYCGRGGDGGVPDSMLCRIDRETLEITVRVFQRSIEETSFPPDSAWVPQGWTLVRDSDVYVDWQAGVALTGDGLVVGSGESTVVFDPVTLEPADRG